MAGFTNYAFRQIVGEYGGVGLYATEFINARGFAFLEKELNAFPDRLWGVKDEPRPLAVQIWDNDPSTLARVGARLVDEFRVKVVDINFGCPVKQVTEKAHSGSYLLRDPRRIGEIVRRVVEACQPTPVTAKIRLGCTQNHITAPQVAQAVEEAGASALTVHGRTAEQYFKGNANWDLIAAVKQKLRHIPLIGNGDLNSPESVISAFENYPIDGVMVARAALGRPWLFRQIAAALQGEPIPVDPSLREQRDCLGRHYELVIQRFGVEKGTLLMRKYACCYAQGLSGARAFRTHASKATTSKEFHAVVDQYFPTE